MLHLAVCAGLRVSELTSLRIADVGAQCSSIRVLGKGRRERALPLWKPTASALRAWLAVRGTVATPEVFDVEAGRVAVRKLPWRVDLKLCSAAMWSMCLALPNTSVLADHGAFRLRSTQPVTVYQFNPLDYVIAGAPEHSYSNDASLLFPTNAWRDDFYVAGWGGMTTNPALVSITAALPNTEVTILSKAPVKGEAGAPTIVAGVPTKVTLGAGDVLELGTAMVDFTGSRVTANAPIQVIAAHYCANVPDFFGDCDHLEESMLPIATLGTRYVITAPAVPTLPGGKQQTIRIVAVDDATTLTYDPPQPGLPTTLARAGDVIEIPRRAGRYAITATHQILVEQLMLGQQVEGGIGDPSMALAVPVEQFRTDYQFHAPTNYEINYVDIVAPTGAQIVLDGQLVGQPEPIGASGWNPMRIRALANGPNGDGNHVIRGDHPFGISVYGYGEYTSYWYPGGLDLKDVIR